MTTYGTELALLLQSLVSVRETTLRLKSQRAWARKLGMPASKWHDLLKGKRLLSAFYANRISEGLKLSEEEKTRLFRFITTKSRRTPGVHQLTLREYDLVYSWEHYALLNLLKTKDAQSNPDWISERLGLPVTRTQEVLNDLFRAGMLEYEGDNLRRTRQKLTTSVDVPNERLRQALGKNLEKAAHQLKSVPVQWRDFSSITMPIDEFRRRVSQVLEQGEPSEVFQLNIQLYPVTQIQQGE
jgi:predicted transcriptional regulator